MIVKYFSDYPELVAGTTTYSFGDCSKHSEFDVSSSMLKCYKKLLDKYSFSNLIIPNATHSNISLTIESDNLSLPSDALITSQKNILIAVPTADCIPVFLYEPNQKVIGIVHCGRIGLRDHITENTIKKMIDDFNIDKSNLIIQIGPHICSQCYQVSAEILSEYGISSQHEGFLNMEYILISNLCQIGISIKQIRLNTYCTLCSKDPLFFSYRNNNDKRRNLSFIGMK